MSIEELAKMIPVSPPKVNRKMKPKAHSKGVSRMRWVLEIVDSQLKILIPVGMAMIMVAAVK